MKYRSNRSNGEKGRKTIEMLQQNLAKLEIQREQSEKLRNDCAMKQNPIVWKNFNARFMKLQNSDHHLVAVGSLIELRI